MSASAVSMEAPIRCAAAVARAADAKPPLRIALVSADYPSVSNGAVGGIGAHTYALAHAIADLGHDVSVITQCEGRARRENDGSVMVHALARGSARMWKLGGLLPVQWLRRSYAVASALRSLHREAAYDLVSFPDGYGEGFRYSFAPLSPYVVQLFGPASVVQRWDGRAIPRMRAWGETFMERRPAASADLVISATRSFADRMARDWSLDRGRIRIIRNPLDLARFRPADRAPPQARQRVLFVGHLQRLKGLHALAAAVPLVMARAPQAAFELVGNDTRSGPGGTSMMKALQQQLRESGVAERVIFTGELPQREIVSRYQGCSVFVLPSLHDVYPNAVLEAMACGRPCVVTRTVGAAELVEESGCGRVVPPDDAPALGAAIGELLALPEAVRAEMGARGRRIVEQACATPVIAAQMVAAYRDAIDARAARLRGERERVQ